MTLVRVGAATLAMMLLCMGCGSSSKTPQASQTDNSGRIAASSSNNATPQLSPAAAALRDRLTNSNNGLEVRRLMLLNQSQRIAGAMVAHAESSALDADATERLKRNGFRLVRIPRERADELIRNLGQASYDAIEWHGQVNEWRPIVERPIERGGRAVAIDGVVSHYDHGNFRILLRAWTVQMEDGPFLYLEMMPTRQLPQVNDLRSMLANVREPDQSFASMAVHLRLDANFVYALMCESPQVDWPGLDAPANDGSSTSQRSRSTRSRGGASDALGPDVIAPPTLGELLLSSQREPVTRTALIFIPKIGPELYLPEQISLNDHR